MPPNPRYSWVLSERCCSVAGVGGVSSSVWRPSLSGFIPPSVIANGASSLPVSSTPLAGQSVSTETSDGSAIVQRDAARSTILPRLWVWVRINLSPEKLKNPLRIIHILQRPPSASWQLWGRFSGSGRRGSTASVGFRKRSILLMVDERRFCGRLLEIVLGLSH